MAPLAGTAEGSPDAQNPSRLGAGIGDARIVFVDPAICFFKIQQRADGGSSPKMVLRLDENYLAPSFFFNRYRAACFDQPRMKRRTFRVKAGRPGCERLHLMSLGW